MVAAATARRRDEWERTTLVVQAVFAAFGSEPPDAAQINPYHVPPPPPPPEPEERRRRKAELGMDLLWRLL